jgi:hypothetical protein
MLMLRTSPKSNDTAFLAMIMPFSCINSPACIQRRDKFVAMQPAAVRKFLIAGKLQSYFFHRHAIHSSSVVAAHFGQIDKNSDRRN